MTIAEHVSGYPSYIIPPISAQLYISNCSIYPPLRGVPYTRPCVVCPIYPPLLVSLCV